MLTQMSKNTMPDLGVLFAPLEGRAVVGLAVSGGVDSLALMILVQQWAKTLTNAPKLFVYTLDHGLRPEAANECAFVVRCADELGLVTRALTWDGVKPKSGIQAAARQARYRLIGDAMALDGAEVLLTAHHQGDQAETLLMRMAHGSGLKGLAGMRVEAVVEGVSVFRPLLDVRKDMLDSVVVARGWQAIADPSNDDLQYERVRWRQMLPQLGQLGLDGGVLAGLAKRLGRAERALDAMADTAFVNFADVDRFGTVRLDAKQLDGVQAEIQLRLVQKALGLAGDQRKPFALAQIEQLAGTLSASEFVPVTLFGCKISLHQSRVVFAREAGRMSDVKTDILPDQLFVWDGRFEIANRGDAPVQVQPARNFSKKLLGELLGRTDFRMADIGGAPVVTNAGGAILAVGTQVFDSAINVRFCRAGGVGTG